MVGKSSTDSQKNLPVGVFLESACRLSVKCLSRELFSYKTPSFSLQYLD